MMATGCHHDGNKLPSRRPCMAWVPTCLCAFVLARLCAHVVCGVQCVVCGVGRGGVG